MENETHALHHERKGKKHIMCVMCPDDEATAKTIMKYSPDPDDEIKQRHDAMKLAMNDPEKMREYYEDPCY